MILLLYPWQNHKGATHLKKIDTPPACFSIPIVAENYPP
jgi:hypothetical protein